jgi:hypothetical protein
MPPPEESLISGSYSLRITVGLHLNRSLRFQVKANSGKSSIKIVQFIWWHSYISHLAQMLLYSPEAPREGAIIVIRSVRYSARMVPLLTRSWKSSEIDPSSIGPFKIRCRLSYCKRRCRGACQSHFRFVGLQFRLFSLHTPPCRRSIKRPQIMLVKGLSRFPFRSRRRHLTTIISAMEDRLTGSTTK